MHRIAETLIAALGFLALLGLLLAGLGYQSGAFSLQGAFALLRWCAYAGIASAALAIFYLIWQRPAGLRLAVLFAGALMGLTAFYLPYRQQQLAAQAPPIHDISTDVENPPAFVAVVPLRGGASNPPEYDGEETARAQREAYPDIMPMLFTQPPAEVFQAALAVARDMGWEVVAAEEDEGRIEAVATTRWFGFKDDVVIRLTPAGVGTRLDIRSKSRIGRSDIGANARRIRDFRAALNAELAD